MSPKDRNLCPECIEDVSRRDFVKVVGGLAAVSVPIVGSVESTLASSVDAPTKASAAETTVKQLYESLSDKQKGKICFAFDHPLRLKHNPNWAITDPAIGSDFYSKEQRQLIDQIVREVSSEDGYERFKLQMLDDEPGGIESYYVAIFGEPGTGDFEWEMTGRHLTLRADGNSVDNMAFGGPIVYGHSEENTKKNLFYYQTQIANEVFQALDPGQAKQALLPKAPAEGQVPLQGDSGTFPGVSVGEFSSDQIELFEKAIKVILAPYRQEDVDEAVALLKEGGGLKKLNMAFYQNGDNDNDKIWDIWRVEGPTFVWHFRGKPHVHAYVNIGKKS